MLRLTSILCAFLLLSANCSQAGSKPGSKTTPAATGESTPMPSVKVIDLDNKAIDLKTLSSKGRTTVISFWATWCGPCKMELQSYNQVFKNWKTQYNADFYAISVDQEKTAADLKNFAKKMGWDFNVLFDNAQAASKTFSIATIPFLIVVDKKGKLCHKQVGFSQGAESELETVLAKIK